MEVRSQKMEEDDNYHKPMAVLDQLMTLYPNCLHCVL